MELFELAMYKAMNGSGDGGGDEPIVYIPEQTVTTVYDEGYGAYLSTITTNFDLDDLPPYIMLTVDDTTIQLEKEDDYNFQSENYGVFYNIDDEVWVFGAWNEGQSDTYTIYGTYEEPTFSTASVTFTNNTSSAVYFHIPHILPDKMYTNLRVARDEDKTVEIALYNGLCVGLSVSIGVDLSVTGDIELEGLEGTTLFISGDGTVTVSGSGGGGK